MKYVGLDLSLTGTGVCVLDDDGHTLCTIATAPRNYPTRFDRIDSITKSILDRLPPKEEVIICIETSFVHPERMAGQQDILNLAYAVRRALYYQKYGWRDVAPNSLKLFVMGKGSGSKDMIAKAVWQKWGIDAKDNNQADAAGLAQIAKVIHLLSLSAEPESIPEYQIAVARKALAGK